MPDASEFMNRALQYQRSATALFDLHDYNSACNRAYYAMFNATKALIMQAPHTDRMRIGKTHKGLSTLLYTSLVQPGRMDGDIAALMGKIESLRLSGDYSGEALMQGDAATALHDCDRFMREANRIFNNGNQQ